MDPTVFFTPDEVARARAYHRPLYLALAADICLSTVVTALLAFGWLGDRLYDAVPGPWWVRSLLFTGLVVAAVDVVRLPLAFWRGFVRERRWGFSTQSSGGWALDQAKAFAVGVVLTSAAMVALLGAIRLFPSWWPLVATLGASLLVLLLVFVAPVLLEPVFNRFEPLEDAELAGALRGLAQRAGVPVRDVLVADASRRTRKHNAYVSGIGGTRRVVLFDTLLGEAARPELEVIVAHELGHRRHRDVLKGTLLAMCSAAVAVLVAWPLDPTPRRIPLLLLVWGALELVTLPLTAAFSRRLERRADRFALELTRDASAFEAAFRRMAEANLADLDPPRLVYAFMFTHPTPTERIAMGEHLMHNHTHSSDRRALAIALALIAAFLVGEVVAALIAGSLALLADAGHMLTDAGALAFALFAATLAGRPAHGRWTFGYKRLEILAAQANGVTLLVVALLIVFGAVRRLVSPTDVRGGIVLLVALVGIGVNVAAAAVLSRASRESLNVRGAFLHIATDTAAFAGTAVAGGLILATGWNRFDPIASLGVAALMLWASWGLLRESASIFLERSPAAIDPEAVGRALVAEADVVEVHDLHVWTVTSGFPALAAHVLVLPDADCHAIRRSLERMLKERFRLEHTTLQVEHAEPRLLTIERR